MLVSARRRGQPPIPPKKTKSDPCKDDRRQIFREMIKMSKKRFIIAIALLLCMSLTACNQNVDLTEDPNLSDSISGSADVSGVLANYYLER